MYPHDVLQLNDSPLVEVRIERLEFDTASFWTRFIVHGWLPESPLRTIGGDRENAWIRLAFEEVVEVRVCVGLTGELRANFELVSPDMLEASAVVLQRESAFADTNAPGSAKQVQHVSIVWDPLDAPPLRIDVLCGSLSAEYATFDGPARIVP